jgi:large subunit ribosomal protein L25
MANTAVTVAATVRKEHGKGAARRVRAQNKIPGVIYGPGKQPSGVAVDPKDITKALTGPHKRNAVITLNLNEGGARTVMVKELQLHPVKRTPTHIDFYEVSLDKPVRVLVPIEITGKAKAAADGGKVNLVVRGVNLEALPGALPTSVVYDVTDQGFGVVRAKQLARPLMLVHGTADDNVLFEHTLRLTEAFQKEGRLFELMIYPGKAHGISGKPAQLHVYKTVTTFFDEKLR